ncbi:Bromodomain [Popillia japonica]|uniref:Bromodomain n=1 Tax=Popillia japonica TaxID=7064 RepID=A0AAW1M3B9_POPJA
MIAYPWAYTEELPHDAEELQYLCENVAKVIENVRGTKYEAGPGIELLGYASGASDDWVKGVGKVELSYTFELPDPKWLFLVPPSEILGISEEAFEGMKSSDVEGIRHSSGNWQRDPNKEWGKRLLVKPLEKSKLDKTRKIVEALAVKETAHYNREMRHRPIMINTSSTTVSENGKGKRKRKHYHTRSAEMEGSEVEQDDGDANSSGTEYSTNRDTEFSDSSSSSSESSGYSDWVADEGVTLEPPKRSKRKQIARQTSPVNNEETKPKWEPHEITPNIEKIKEVPENYKPSDWLAETMPKKVPYFPQMGDEVVYFRQGHQLYVTAVQTKKVYEMNAKDFPWIKNQLKDCEFVKIVGIKYEIRPPRLCCLKLALLDRDGRLTGNVFTVKYHDMPDVIDFFVLKQTYEVAISRSWNAGDRFRCMIDDAWWVGEVVSKSPVSEDFSDSLFMCYEIRWDNGEFERMSPWDMEPLKEDRMPANPCDAVPVLPEEIQFFFNRNACQSL